MRIKNETSSGSQEISVLAVIEWLDKGMVVELPPRTVASGHLVAGKLRIEQTPPIEIEITAKVKSATASSDSHLRVELDLIQFEQSQWDEVRKEVQAEQTELQEKLHSARGSETPELINDALQKAFLSFITNQRILIADSSPASRESLRALLVRLGAQPQLTFEATDFQSAKKFMSENPIGVVLADYDFDSRRGVNLVQDFNRATKKKGTAILITTTSSQTAFARAVEEDVEAIVMKPLSGELIKGMILRSVASKIAPAPAQKLVAEAWEKIRESHFQEAETLLKQALTQIPDSTSAISAMAFVHLGKKDYTKSEELFRMALSTNKYHFRSMEGLSEALSQQGRTEDAYQLLIRMSQYFPPNPQRLSQVLRLALRLGDYDGIEKLAASSQSIIGEDDAADRYLSAALVVCGVHYLNTKSQSRAISLFDKAAQLTRGSIRTHREIISNLVEHRAIKEAAQFFAKIPKDLYGLPEFQHIRFIIDSVRMDDFAIQEQGAILLKSHPDPLILRMMIRSAERLGDQSAMKRLKEEGKVRWPDFFRDGEEKTK